MKVNQEIRDALHNASIKAGQVQSFCEQTGLSTRQFHGYRGQNPRWAINSIPELTWEALFPHIRDFLPDDLYYYPRSDLLKLARCWRARFEDGREERALRAAAHREWREKKKRRKKIEKRKTADEVPTT